MKITIVFGLLVASTTCQAQLNCVITGGTNNGTIIQICTIPGKLTFQSAIAEELVGKLSPGKPVTLMAVGSPSDWAVGTEYASFIQGRGFNVNLNRIGAQIPPPDHPITINDSPNMTFVTIFPAAR
jgi:hypothetical protein